MIESLDETLAWLKPRFSRALIPADALKRVRSMARRLPSTPSFAFECRLGEGQRRVDFLTCVTQGWGCDELGALGPGARGPLAGPAWERIAAFCKEWESSELLRGVSFFWLEFDLPGAVKGSPPPFPTVCVQPGFRRGQLVKSPGREAEQIRRRTWRTLEVLSGGPMPRAVERSVARCFEALPPGSGVMHVAPFTVRGADTVRLVLYMPRRRLPEYLARIGWPGRPAEVEERVMGLLDFSGIVDLYLDVGERVLEPVGMGYPVPETPGDPRGPILLDRLVAAGLCTPQKRDGLLQWVGRESAMLPGAQWPSQLLRTASIKLVHRPRQPIEAKAYVELEARFALLA